MGEDPLGYWMYVCMYVILEIKPRRCGREIVSQLSAKASTKLPHTYIHKAVAIII